MNVVMLPTVGPLTYRGKYPHRMRIFSNGDPLSKIHSRHMGDMKSPHFVELNNGKRFYIDGFFLADFNLPTKHAELGRFDWSPVIASAEAMPQEAYDAMLDEIRRYRAALEKNRKRITAKQEGGDDGYCYVVRVDGIERWNGLTRREVEYYKKIELEKLMEKFQ